MTNLYSSYYIDPSPQRQKELDECLRKNIENKLIDMIYLFVEYPIENELVKNKKIKQCYIKGRPTFSMFFLFVNMSFPDNETTSIICNSDIYFDQTLTLLKHPINKCLALTRYDVKRTGTFFLNRVDSQDCWIFKGKIKPIEGDFYMGQAGCDNAIADRIHKAGYEVINPSKTIKCYHLHESGIRSYNKNDRVANPYKLLAPTI